MEMDTYIIKEALLFIDSMYIGLVVMAFYDVLRLLRRIVRHRLFMVNLQDFIYFTIAGFVVFSLIYSENNGNVRWFILFGNVAGAWIYEKSFGKFLVKYSAKYIKIVLNTILKKPLQKVIIMFRKIRSRRHGKKLRKKEKIT